MATIKSPPERITSPAVAPDLNGASTPCTLPPLEPGDHLDQPTFHARYEAMPSHVRAELIGGVVFMPSPARTRHGKHHNTLNGWLWTYKRATPGTEAYDNTTAILGEESEPQPDGFLVIEPGGQTRIDEQDWLHGAPEWVGEVSTSTESYDLHAKKQDYEQAGVKEYVVIALRQAQVFWFILRQGKYEPLAPGPDGIYRSETFPGLWLDPDALLRRDEDRLLAVLQQGLGSPEHAEFVRRLGASST